MAERDVVNLIDEVLALPDECEWAEFKHDYIDAMEIGEYISALSNSAVIHRKENAYVLWGIKDGTREVVGTSFVPSKAKRGGQALEMWLSQKLQPRPHFEFRITDYQGKPVVLLTIRPVRERPLKFDGAAYVRVGSHKTKLDSQPGKEQAFWTQVVAGDSGSWDERKDQAATFADLDDDAINDFIERLRRAGRRSLPAQIEPHSLLEKMRLSVDGIPTRAAILLLGKDPKRSCSTAFIKAGRFKSATDIADDKEFTGTLFEQLDQAMTWLQERMSKKLIIGKTPVDKAKLSGALVERGRLGLSTSLFKRSYSKCRLSSRLHDRFAGHHSFIR